MSSKSNLRKRSKTLPARLGEDRDRISNLPTSLIEKIISYISLKDAVATCILAKKWKHFWTFYPNLEFEDKLGDLEFKDMVNQVLLQRGRSFPLQRLYLNWDEHCDRSDVNAWIAYALACKVQELDISVPTDPFLFPPLLLHCKTLVVLKLDVFGWFYTPIAFCLPVLKTLHLGKVTFSNNRSIAFLLSCCPVLEDLKLSRCRVADMDVLNIFSPTLITLRIDCWHYKGFEVPYIIITNTPSLRCFNFREDSARGYVVKNVDHVIAADIDIRVPAEEELLTVAEFSVHVRDLPVLLNSIRRVQRLVLSRNTINTVASCHMDFHEFPNLTYLEITSGFISWVAITSLLEKSPRLQSLYLRKVPYMGKINTLIDDLGVPSCFNLHLKSVELDGFDWLQKGMLKMLQYILKNAKVMEKLKLHEGPLSLQKKLVKVPRASSICKIETV